MDSVDLGGFRWSVPRTGFQWAREAGTGDLWLYEKPVEGGGMTPMRRTEPARKTPLLHQTFARLADKGTDEILRFTNRYGRLGIPEQVELDDVGLVVAERLSRWKTSAKSMAASVLIVKAVRQGTLTVLNQCIERLGELQDESPGTYDIDGLEPLAARACTRRADAAQHCQRMFARHVAILVANHIRLVPADRKGSIEFRARPSSLLGFMWMGLIVDLEGRGEARKCLFCGQEFFITTSLGARGNRRFCSNLCKSAIFRQRQKKAAKLAAMGETAAQIAKKLSVPGSGISTESVQRWLGES